MPAGAHTPPSVARKPSHASMQTRPCLTSASRIQSLSHLNKRDWMKVDTNATESAPKEKAEPDWVYGYNAWEAPLAEHELASA